MNKSIEQSYQNCIDGWNKFVELFFLPAAIVLELEIYFYETYQTHGNGD